MNLFGQKWCKACTKKVLRVRKMYKLFIRRVLFSVQPKQITRQRGKRSVYPLRWVISPKILGHGKGSVFPKTPGSTFKFHLVKLSRTFNSCRCTCKVQWHVGTLRRLLMTSHLSFADVSENRLPLYTTSVKFTFPSQRHNFSISVPLFSVGRLRPVWYTVRA